MYTVSSLGSLTPSGFCGFLSFPGGRGVMEGPSFLLSAAPEGDPRASGQRDTRGDAGSEPTWDMKTHFRVCRFIMESGGSLAKAFYFNFY